MKEIEEHDIVIVGNLSPYNLCRIGTVVHIYPDGNTYEVEFGVQEGKESVETVTKEQITKVLK